MKPSAQMAWLLGLLIAGGAHAAVAAEKVLTFDALPRGATFSSYTEDGITFAGTGGTVFSTVLNPQNGTTAIEITSSDFAATCSISMGGRYFSLRSFSVVAPAVGSPVLQRSAPLSVRKYLLTARRVW